MKSTKQLIIALLMVVLVVCVGQAPRNEPARSDQKSEIDPITGLPPAPPTRTRDPNFGRVTLAAGERTWELGDLYRTAAAWLAEKEHAPDEYRTNATVTVYLQNKEELCQFSFTHPSHFLRPFWLVSIGYDGKVKSCVKFRTAEGEVPQVKMPPPPPDIYSNK